MITLISYQIWRLWGGTAFVREYGYNEWFYYFGESWAPPTILLTGILVIMPLIILTPDLNGREIRALVGSALLGIVAVLPLWYLSIFGVPEFLLARVENYHFSTQSEFDAFKNMLYIRSLITMLITELIMWTWVITWTILSFRKFNQENSK